MRSHFLIAIAFLLSIAACGSSNGVSTAPRQALLPLAEDIDPDGERLDLRDRNYFPATLGDTWTYTRRVETLGRDPVDIDPSNTATREITRVDGEEFSVTESTARESETIRYARGSGGITQVMPLDGIYPDTVSELVGDLVEFPEPFFPIGRGSTSIRQGPWPEDIDGDGRPESFRIEMTRTLVDISTLDMPRDRLSNVAHFSVTTTMRIIPSDGRYAESVATFGESTWWAPGIGLVQAIRRLTVGAQVDVEYLELSAAIVSGRPVFPSAVDGTATRVAVEHADLTFDPLRGKYYASIPDNSDVEPSRVAIIDANSGALTYSPRTVPGNPGPLAVSSDASAVFVAVNGSGDIVKYQLPGWQELWRVQLPVAENRYLGQAKQIEASPMDPDAVVVSFENRGVSPPVRRIALIRAGAVQTREITDVSGLRAISIDPDGSSVYALVHDSSQRKLRDYAVLQDGLIESRAVDLSYTGHHNLATSSGGVIIDDQLLRRSDLAIAGQADVGAGNCRELTQTHRWLCLDHSYDTINLSRQPRTVSVVDPDTMATVYRPVYERGQEITIFGAIEPGATGQVALRIRSDGDFPSWTGVMLFSSPLLQ